MSQSDQSVPQQEAQLVGDFSNTGDAEADGVSNRTGGGYDDRDAATETGAGGRETASAWHTARDDADARKND